MIGKKKMMTERKPFPVEIDGQPVELTEDNHGIALFRDRPDNDYLDFQHDVSGEEAHTLIFRQPELFMWMGNIALTDGDRERLDAINESAGLFRDRTGWNSHVYIEDTPSEFEEEMLAKSLLKDLDSTDTVPEGWE